MVLAGNEAAIPTRNGRRSGTNSPKSPPTAGASDEEEIARIRVGRDYQAAIPEVVPDTDETETENVSVAENCSVPDNVSVESKNEATQEKALLVWSPVHDITDARLDKYVHVAKTQYGYNGEQALGMLFWHKHNLDRAILDLSNFTPFPDEWTNEDKILFEQAFSFHGKNFAKIRQMLPDKPISSLVKHYYSWKKTRAKTSLMDKQAKRRRKKSSDNEEDSNSNHGSSDGDTEALAKVPKDSCSNCGVACHKVRSTPKGHACHSCYQHWRRTGVVRPLSSMPGRMNKRKLPRGILVNHDDLAALAGQPNQVADACQSIDVEIVSLKRQIQMNKQQIGAVKRKLSPAALAAMRPSETKSRITSRWSNDELLLAVQGVRKYGKDAVAIAETIGTKNESHLKSFFVNYRRRFNLDAVLAEYEADQKAEAAAAAVGDIASGAADNAVANASETSVTALNSSSVKIDVPEVKPETDEKVENDLKLDETLKAETTNSASVEIQYEVKNEMEVNKPAQFKKSTPKLMDSKQAKRKTSPSANTGAKPLERKNKVIRKTPSPTPAKKRLLPAMTEEVENNLKKVKSASVEKEVIVLSPSKPEESPETTQASPASQ
ncbi:REST corepressor 1 isoform X2 [Trichogramma pretiosum]|uniref:REST corepressor 1 isoform X2 n=1 Tax=Trichogramma pretiosum TaxID=7493 RepID=UPI0006C9A1AC|nr:REST corepressor 1 isoform X2 [Trichogramma pretiosum]